MLYCTDGRCPRETTGTRETGGALRGNEALGVQSQAVLRGFRLDPGKFVESIRDYARNFFTMVGCVQRIDLEARRRGSTLPANRGACPL